MQINEILTFFFKKKYPLFEETINFNSKLNNICLTYQYPNPFNEIFLGIDWLSIHFFSLLNSELLFNILIRILLEHSIIFLSEYIQHLTITVLGFSYLIRPFTWPFIIIPNLPIDLMNMIDSPVPYLIGILGDKNLKKEMIKKWGRDRHFDILYIGENKIEFIVIFSFIHFH